MEDTKKKENFEKIKERLEKMDRQVLRELNEAVRNKDSVKIYQSLKKMIDKNEE